MQNKEIERLRTIETTRVEKAIKGVLRGGEVSELAMLVAAHILLRANSEMSISMNTIGEYLDSSNEEESMELVIRQSFGSRWNRLRELKHAFTKDELKAFILFYEMEGNRTADMATPTSVAKIAARLIAERGGKRVLDIGTGRATFIRESFILNPQNEFKGLEINTELALVAKIRIALISGDIDIQKGNIFDDNCAFDRKFDAVFANYPFGMRRHSMQTDGLNYIERISSKSPEYKRISSMDWVFNRRAYECVGGPNRAVCIMTNGSTWNTRDQDVRASFVNDGSIEMVIALPSRIFEGTGIGTVMIVFSHGNESVMMVDASGLFERGRRCNTISDDSVEQIFDACHRETEISRRVSIEEIKGNRYSLNPAAYLAKPMEEVKNGIALEDVVTIRRGAQFSAAMLDEMASEVPTNNQYMMLSNMQDGTIDEDLPYLKDLEPRMLRHCLEDGDLVLSKSGMPYKIAAAEVKGDRRILVTGNMYVLTVKDRRKIEPYYLMAYLDSDRGRAALKGITVGSVLPSLGIRDLKELKIPMLPIEEQKRIADEYRICLTEMKALRLRTQILADKMHHVYDKFREE